MTGLDLEEILRRELHAAAESIEPGADGLNLIRARLSVPRPLPVAWLMVGWTSVLQPTLLWMDSVLVAFGDWLRAMMRPVLGPLHPATRGMQPALNKLRVLFTPRTEPSGRPSRYAWLRPALAMAAVVAVAVAGGFALSGLPRTIQQAANSMLSNPSHTSKNGHGPGVTGSGKPSPAPGAASPSPTPTASCTPAPRSSSSPKPYTTPTPNPTPTPTPTPSVSPSPTTSPSPTPSASASENDPTTQSAGDTSDLILTSVTRSNSPAKAHPSPSPTCTPGSS
jgi:hypothetical protein